MLMKKYLAVAAATTAVLVCTGVAVDVSSNNQANVKADQVSQVQKLKSQLSDIQTAKASREAALSQAADQINVLTQKSTSLTQTNATLCAQIKAARLSQPLCK
jgi:peptidoglycan hydrolase CwlO-like protein